MQPAEKPDDDPQTMKIYGMTGSGNCWKPAVLMKQLQIPFEWIEVDILNGRSRTPELLSKNPNGKVPLLEITAGKILARSHPQPVLPAHGPPLQPAERLPRS